MKKISADLRDAWLMVIPALAILVLFRVLPLIIGVGYSFTDFNGVDTPEFIGLDNYYAVAADPVFHDSLINTLLMLATLPIWIGVPLVLAILIHQGVPGASFYRAVYFFPAVLSSVIIGAIFNVILRYDGSLNAALDSFGISAVDWLGDSSTALMSLLAVQLWSTFGVTVLIFMAGLSTMSSEMIEAARLDGAKPMQIFRHIMVPSLWPIIEFAAILTMIGMLTSMFGLIYVLTAGGPGTSTTLPEFLIWLEQGRLNRPGYASAVSMVLFVIMGTLGWLQVRVMSRNTGLS